MADSYVCSGATMKCTMGDQSAQLTVLPSRTVFLCGKPMANISDHASMVNLAPFGKCRSLAYPATAAATAAALGKLTPMPCVHNTPMPWTGGKSDYLIKGQPALLKSCKCTCIWGGMISITDDGQKDTSYADVRRVPKRIYKQQIKNTYKFYMTPNSILHGSINLERRLDECLDILQDYIDEDEHTAKSIMEENLFTGRPNCTKDGYFIGVNNEVFDNIKWPEPNFEVGTKKIIIVPPNRTLDRFNDENGFFFTDSTSPKGDRCIPEGHQKKYSEHHQYITREPLIAIQSKVAPGGFGQRGGAVQYEFCFNTTKRHHGHVEKEEKKWQIKDTTRDLVEMGFLDQIKYTPQKNDDELKEK